MLKHEKRKEFIEAFPDICLKTRVKVRVFVISLSTGENEVLITSLLDKNSYKYNIFKELYNERWGGEENYKFHKVSLQIENFSGKSPVAVEQDFHATVLAANIRNLLANEAQEELDENPPEKKRTYEYKINKNISAGILKDDLIIVLFDPKKNLELFCDAVKKKMKKNIIPIRPERAFMHKRKSRRKYPMNTRRAL